MRRYRRNADQGARELERRFAQGDQKAGAELVRALFRTGQLTVQRAVAMGDIVPRTLAELDPRFAEGVAYLFAGSEQGECGAYHRMISSDGQFFPDHDSAEECPRGHRNEDGAEWAEVELESRTRNVLGHNMEGLLMIEGHSEGHDAPVAGIYLGCFTQTGGPPQGHRAEGPRTFCNSFWRVRRDDVEYV